MEIRLNGVLHKIKPGISIRELILSLELDPKNVAVERNLEIVPKSLHADIMLNKGDALEIVEFVGGG